MSEYPVHVGRTRCLRGSQWMTDIRLYPNENLIRWDSCVILPMIEPTSEPVSLRRLNWTEYLILCTTCNLNPCWDLITTQLSVDGIRVVGWFITKWFDIHSPVYPMTLVRVRWMVFVLWTKTSSENPNKHRVHFCHQTNPCQTRVKTPVSTFVIRLCKSL